MPPSNGLAHLLIDAGCRRGDRIALMMPKSPMAIIAMLGVLKCDATYVPMDPASPRRGSAQLGLGERGEAILDRAGRQDETAVADLAASSQAAPAGSQGPSDVGRIALEDAQHGNDRHGTLPASSCDSITAAAAGVDQQVGKPVAGGIERSVGNARVVEDDGRRRRVARSTAP